MIYANKFKTKKYHKYADILSSALGEASACLFRNPFELVKQNLQVNNFNNLRDAVRNIYISKGFMGFFRGYTITLMRDIPFGLIQFPIYEAIKRKMNKKSLTILDSSFAGAIAGTIAAISTTPLDVIKTRIMIDRSKSKTLIIKEIYRDGVMNFFSGLKWRVIYISIGGIFFFSTNEYVKKHLGYYKKL